jgi:glutamate carboxypeptidase
MLEAATLTAYLERELPAALEVLRRMVEINSFTTNRDGIAKLARLTAETFAPLGFAAESVPSVNPSYGEHLILTRGGTGRSLAMVSHLDTVFPPEEEERNNFRWLREGDRIYGPGTCDIKGGTVMMWLVLRALREFAPAVFEEISWRLFWNSSEETLSADFGEVVRSRLDSGTIAALVFEAEGREGNTRNVVVARKGRATWRITALGRGAHAGSKFALGANAVIQLAHTLTRVATIGSADLSVNAGTISGGTVINRVPHEAYAEGEMRSFSPEALARGKAALLALAGPGEVRAAADGHACEVRVEVIGESLGWPRNPATDRLAAIWLAEAGQLAIPAGTEQRGGLSDGNMLWDAVPTLDGLGPWGDHAHCSERNADGTKLPEYVEVSSFVPKAALNARAILSLVHSASL